MSSFTNRKTLRLGTRRSLLAMAQSSAVARQIENLLPGVEIELVGIETRGDRILDIPLQKMEGKDFFVAELDQALISGKVDFCVHSMKDLSLERPQEIISAATPRRESPHDVVIFAPGIRKRLESREPIRIGTSSPRRLENIPPFLNSALPQPHGKVKCVEIRGNVNTRLSRLHEPEGSERYLDGVVLAFAGLIRLWADPESREGIRDLLRGVRWMVLPISECPTACAQGALAVECRRDDLELREILARLNDPLTWNHVSRERNLLDEFGGGCHQRFGATSFSHPELGDLFYIKGLKPDGTPLDELRWQRPDLMELENQASESENVTAWNGAEWRSNHTETEYLSNPIQIQAEESAVFIAHSRAVPQDVEGLEWVNQLRSSRIWTAGTLSWKKLAARGFWVEGCTDGLGFDHMTQLLAEPVLQLPDLSQWTVLTHEQSAKEWGSLRNIAKVYPTYRLKAKTGKAWVEAEAALKDAKYIYWTSGSQFQLLHSKARPDAQHACGPGRTAQVLRAHGIQPLVFPSEMEWRKWIGN